MRFLFTIIIVFASLIGQSQNFPATITHKDVIIVGVQKIDTFYYITSHPKKPYLSEKNFFETLSKYEFYTDTLNFDYLHQSSKKKFFDEDCIFNRHAYIVSDFAPIIYDNILPEITDETLKKTVLKTYKENYDGYAAKIKINSCSELLILNRHCGYEIVNYNTEYFLIVLMTAKKFSEKINKHLSPGCNYFMGNVNKQDAYLKLAIPILVE